MALHFIAFHSFSDAFCKLLTLGMHAQEGLQYFVSKFVCLSSYFLPLCAMRQHNRHTNRLLAAIAAFRSENQADKLICSEYANYHWLDQL